MADIQTNRQTSIHTATYIQAGDTLKATCKHTGKKALRTTERAKQAKTEDRKRDIHNQINRIHRQKYTQTYRGADKQTIIHTQPNKHTPRQTRERDITDKHINIHTCRDEQRQAQRDEKLRRQTYRQTYRHANTHGNKHTNTHKETT